MKKIANSILFTWLLIRKSFIFWLLMLFFIGFEFITALSFTTGNDYDPGITLKKLCVLVQGGMLIFMFLGVIFVRIEEKHNLNELYGTIVDGVFAKIMGKILFSISFIFFVCNITYAIFFLVVLNSNLPVSHFYWSAYLYILLFWGMPLLISLLIGILLASLNKGKFIYPLLIFIWCFIGPLNTFFIGHTTQQIGFDMFPLLISLGEPTPYAPFDALYGYPLSLYYWSKNLLWVLTITVLLGITYLLKKNSRRIFYSTILALVMLVPIVYYLSLDHQLYITAHNNKQSREFYEHSYYTQARENPFDKQNILFNDYQIDLSIKRNLKAEVVLNVVNQEDHSLNHVIGTLYHQFKIKKVYQENKELSFKQVDDFFKINLHESLSASKSTKIKIIYEGISSPLFFADSNAIYLPYYFPWLPSDIQEPAFKLLNNDLIRINHQNKSQTSYSLKYNGPGNLYTNIESINPDVWKGKSLKGLTLVSGELTSRIIKDDTFIEPNTWIKNINEFNNFKKHTKRIIDNIGKDLEIDNLNFPSTIMYIPTLGLSDVAFEEFIWYDHNHLIYGGPAQNGSEILPEASYWYTYWLIPALTWKHENVHINDFNFLLFFDRTYAYFYNKHNNIADDGSLLMGLNITDNKEQNDIIQKVNNWVKSNEDKERGKNFFKDWFFIIKSNNANWNDLEQLLEKYGINNGVK
ncbi:hypothetical protein [Bacillus wiedmannii]|uniref:hypothetical protein n=1 Tax=Bacillus wiedmannii TaxID=1890302 RepID=UPI000D09037D|nr:hypothetical protein [Bacillus wiedmannii]PRT15853.1 hypothetical protein C6360_27405 [Bacillus wiedmannii]